MTNQAGNRELTCWNCGHSLTDVPRPISRHAQCSECFEALHCCRLCRNYRPDVTGQCDEDRADPPVVKENANFCDWFRPAGGAYAEARGDRRAAAEDKLQALFGGDESGDTADADASSADDASGDSAPETDAANLDPAAAAKSKLDDLFSKD